MNDVISEVLFFLSFFPAHVTTSADSSAVAAAFPDRTDGSDMQDKAPDMDDELKHFLSVSNPHFLLYSL